MYSYLAQVRLSNLQAKRERCMSNISFMRGSYAIFRGVGLKAIESRIIEQSTASDTTCVYYNTAVMNVISIRNRAGAAHGYVFNGVLYTALHTQKIWLEYGIDTLFMYKSHRSVLCAANTPSLSPPKNQVKIGDWLYRLHDQCDVHTYDGPFQVLHVDRQYCVLDVRGGSGFSGCPYFSLDTDQFVGIHEGVLYQNPSLSVMINFSYDFDRS